MTDKSTAHVVVLDGTVELETRRCNLLRLPDGGMGAFFHGLVYPLGADGRINIAGLALPPGECTAVDDPIPTKPAGYAIVEGDGEAYLLTAGPLALCDAAAGALRRAGIGVLRTGRWLGDPVGSFAADWFVRYIRTDTPGEVEAAVEPVLGAAAREEREAEAGLRLRLLAAELAAARAREAELRARLGALTAAPPDDGAAADVAELRTALDNSEALRLAAEESLAQAALRPAVPVVEERPPPKPAKLSGEVELVLSVFLARLELLRDSVTVAVAEFRDRRALYRALEELNRGGSKLADHWKPVRGAPGWWERHVGTGYDDTGRLYARAAATGQGWRILVSRKGQQPQDIDWLARRGK